MSSEVVRDLEASPLRMPALELKPFSLGPSFLLQCTVGELKQEGRAAVATSAGNVQVRSLRFVIALLQSTNKMTELLLTGVYEYFKQRGKFTNTESVTNETDCIP